MFSIPLAIVLFLAACTELPTGVSDLPNEETPAEETPEVPTSIRYKLVRIGHYSLPVEYRRDWGPGEPYYEEIKGTYGWLTEVDDSTFHVKADVTARLYEKATGAVADDYSHPHDVIMRVTEAYGSDPQGGHILEAWARWSQNEAYEQAMENPSHLIIRGDTAYLSTTWTNYNTPLDPDQDRDNEWLYYWEFVRVR